MSVITLENEYNSFYLNDEFINLHYYLNFRIIFSMTPIFYFTVLVFVPLNINQIMVSSKYLV